AQAPATAPADSQAAPATSAVTFAGPHGADGHSALAEEVDYEQWKRDVSAVTDEARPYLEERISQGGGEKMAIVLDIDNTSLETHFHPIWELPTPAVEQTLDLARYADSQGVAVYFVTARPGIIYGLTKDNLEKEGFPISGLYVRDLPDIFDEVSKYKTAKRAEIESKGYKIIANIGNTPTDVVGGHAEKTFKLPDYDGALS
ncbi:hydrolase, partial [Streptomyces nanshensis]